MLIIRSVRSQFCNNCKVIQQNECAELILFATNLYMLFIWGRRYARFARSFTVALPPDTISTAGPSRRLESWHCVRHSDEDTVMGSKLACGSRLVTHQLIMSWHVGVRMLGGQVKLFFPSVHPTIQPQDAFRQEREDSASATASPSLKRDVIGLPTMFVWFSALFWG